MNYFFKLVSKLVLVLEVTLRDTFVKLLFYNGLYTSAIGRETYSFNGGTVRVLSDMFGNL